MSLTARSLVVTGFYLMVEVTLFVCPAAAKEAAMADSWPHCQPCNTLTIAQFTRLNDRTPEKTVTVTDAAVIKQLQELLEAMPTSGGKYKSFANETELVSVTLRNEAGVAGVVELYDGQVKTPATTILPGDDATAIKFVEFVSGLIAD